jgi:hypothetical protein
MKVRAKGRLLLPVGLLSALLLSTAYGQRDAQAQAPAAQAAAAGPAPCPGATMPVQATGVYQPKPVPDITVNGQPGPGAIWQAGMRRTALPHWRPDHDARRGAGRVQKRGERIRTLRRGDTEYAPPGVEHWHGAANDASAHYFQTSIGNTATWWMEEVGYDDYMGNDTGITSRNEYLRTGVRKKGDAATQPTKAPAAPKP